MNSTNKIIKTEGKYLTFLFHEVCNDSKESGFQRAAALPYKHTRSVFNSYIESINSSQKQVGINHDQSHQAQYPVLISFDDGGVSNMYSADILESFDMRGIFFITTSLTNKKHFLSDSHIRELRSRGHFIGSHTHTHPNIFRELSFDAMVKEWTESKEILENILSESVNIGSIPGGDANLNAYLSAQKAGYKEVFDSEPMVNVRKLNELTIYGRFCPKSNTPNQVIVNWLDGKNLKKELLKREIKTGLKKVLYPIYSIKRSLDKHNE